MSCQKNRTRYQSASWSKWNRYIAPFSLNTVGLYYVQIRAADNLDNVREFTQQFIVTSSDTEQPSIIDNTLSTCATGDIFTFAASIVDNIEVAGAFVEYWYGSGGHTNTSLSLLNGSYFHDIFIEDTFEDLKVQWSEKN